MPRKGRDILGPGQEVSPVGFEDADTSSLVRGTGVEAEVVGCELPAGECSVVLELAGRWTLPQHVRFA